MRNDYGCELVYNRNMRAGLTGVYERNPNKQTTSFSGYHINLSALAKRVGVCPSHLSRVFSGGAVPSLTLARKLSSELGMSMDSFLKQLDARTSPIYKDAAA
jgi:transcriptional regulator with XRE-family HTH domain